MILVGCLVDHQTVPSMYVFPSFGPSHDLQCMVRVTNRQSTMQPFVIDDSAALRIANAEDDSRRAD
jgi:hypothetical protein